MDTISWPSKKQPLYKWQDQANFETWRNVISLLQLRLVENLRLGGYSKTEIWLKIKGPNVTTAESEPEPMETAGPSSDGFVKTQEDQIDLDLWKVDWSSVESNHEKGTVIRVDKMRPDPWDASYLKEHAIKFLSFHR